VKLAFVSNYIIWLSAGTVTYSYQWNTVCCYSYQWNTVCWSTLSFLPHMYFFSVLWI